MAKPFSYYQLAGLNVSENNELAAFAQDTLSRRIYTIQIKNLKTGKFFLIKSKIQLVDPFGQVIIKLFYTRRGDDLRPYQIWKHTLGTPQSEDELIFEETDDTFRTFIYKTKSREYIVIGSSSTVADEYRFIPANDIDAEWKIIQKRERNLEYSIEHYGDYFYILTNKDNATNFKLMKTPIDQTEKNNWIDVIPHRENVLLENFEIFNNWLVLEERKDALTQINIRSWDDKINYYLPFKEEVFTAYIGNNVDFDSEILRYGYTSMTTPSSVIDFNMKTKESVIKKEQTF